MTGKQKNPLSLNEVKDRVANNAELVLNGRTKLQAAVFDGISEADVAEIVKAQVAKAKSGDAKALEFVMNHILGANGGIHLEQRNVNVITDVETAARIAAGETDNP